MKVKNNIEPAILNAAAAILQPYIAELSPRGLLLALQNFNSPDKNAESTAPRKPLTRCDAARLLSVSLNTVTRYMNTGLLRKIKLGPRLVRIDPESVEEFLRAEQSKA